MSVLYSLAALVGAAQAVPTPHDFPKDDFIGGPFEGLMAELRGEKTQTPPKNLSVVIAALFDVGAGKGKRDLAELTISPATQSYVSTTHPHRGWSGRIEAGFLKKFEGCARTSPWYEGEEGGVQKVRFYWSCDKANPYLTRTEIRFVKGKVQSWEASEYPKMPIIMVPDNG